MWFQVRFSLASGFANFFAESSLCLCLQAAGALYSTKNSFLKVFFLLSYHLGFGSDAGSARKKTGSVSAKKKMLNHITDLQFSRIPCI